MISGKQFYHLERKRKKQQSIQEKRADRQPHSHNIQTSLHTRRHKQTLHKTQYKLICLTIKLHTVHHTTEDLITQRMEFTREEKNRFKEHLLWSSIHRWEEAAPKKIQRKNKTLISWFLMVQEKSVQSWISGCRELSLKAKKESFLFSRLWVSTVQSQDCNFSKGVAMVSKCKKDKTLSKKFRPHVSNESCGFSPEANGRWL